METPNYRKASIYFDDETVLEVTQRGGGGSGVGGDTGLEAVNLITGESTNAALAEKDETIEEQAATIETQAGTIEEQAATIIELQEELADVPTIEALNVTVNGTYSETGKAYSPVTVAVPESFKPLRNFAIAFTNNDHVAIFRCTGTILANALRDVAVERSTGAGAFGGFFATKEPSANRDITILCEGSCTVTSLSSELSISNIYEDNGFTVVKIGLDSDFTIPDYSITYGAIKVERNTQP